MIRYPNTVGYHLQNWVIKCNNKSKNGKIQNFFKLAKTNSPTGFSGAETLPLFGNCFMYIETKSNNHGNNVSFSFERTDIIQFSKITLYYNRFSISTNDLLKAMGRFRNQPLLEDNTWNTRYNIPKNGRYSDTSHDWTFVSLNFSEELYGNKLIYDKIDTAHSDLCFSKILFTHSVY